MNNLNNDTNSFNKNKNTVSRSTTPLLTPREQISNYYQNSDFINTEREMVNNKSIIRDSSIRLHENKINKFKDDLLLKCNKDYLVNSDLRN